MRITKTALFVILLISLAAIYHYTPLHEYFEITSIKEHSAALARYVHEHFLLTLGLYTLVFIALIILSLPASILLTLLGGYLFGIVPAVAASTVAVTIGATISYGMYRWFLQDTLRAKYHERAQVFEQSMQRYGLSYLLMLHFSTLFPYAMINIFAALARVPISKVALATTVGFLPQAVIYAFAGRKLASIESMQDIFTPPVMLALGLLMFLAAVPLVFARLKRHFV